MATLAVPEALLVTAPADKPLSGDTGSAPPGQQASQPAFITTQTLASFSGASAVAAFLWKALAAVAGSWADKRWVPLAISGLIGVWFFLKALDNAKKAADYYGAFLIAVVNTVQIWVAVVGLDVVLDTTVSIDQTGGSTS
jgi:hypothetical protein